jgi:hypothetical protein
MLDDRVDRLERMGSAANVTPCPGSLPRRELRIRSDHELESKPRTPFGSPAQRRDPEPALGKDAPSATGEYSAGHRSLDSGFARGGRATHNGRVQVELLARRTLGLVGPVLAEDADRLLEAIASLAPGGPITLNLTQMTSIDEGGIVAIRRAATMAHDIGGVLVLLLPPTETLDQIRGGGLDEEPMILIEVLET